MATEDRYWSLACPPPIGSEIASTSTFDMTYYADVPDEASSVSVRATAWAINPGRGDDILVDQSVGYTLNSGTASWTLWNGNSWYSFDVWTVGLAKAKAFLVSDGQVTVTSTGGVTRMAAQDRFFVFALNLTSAASPWATGVNTLLVPRSIFLDSKLKADFDAGIFNPLPNADMYGDDLSKASISDGVAAVIAGTLTGAQATDVLNRLLLNASGGSAHTYVDITNTALVANLPSDIVKILPWQSVTNSPTGVMPQDFWSKIGTVASTVVNTLVYVGQMIYTGLVALGTFLVNLAQAIADWGMKALGTVLNAVATAVQKLAEAASNLFNWVKDLAIGAFNLAIGAFKTLAQALLGEVVNVIAGLVRQKATIHNLLFGLPMALGAILKGKQILESVFAAMELVEGSITVVMAVISGGVAAFVKGLVATSAKDTVLKTILGAVVAATVGTIATTTVESFDDDALDNQAGVAAKGFLSGVTLLGAAIDWIKSRKEAETSGVSKWFSAAGWAMVGLLAELAGSPLVEELLAKWGLGDPLSRGLGQLGVDIFATAAATYGLWQLYKKYPGDVFLEGTRKALLPIVANIENWVTYVGFFGSTSALGLHIGQGVYQLLS